MANLRIQEFRGVGNGNQSDIQAASGWAASQTVAIGASSVNSNPVGTGTVLVRLVAEAPCSVSIGSNPTAVTGGGGRLSAFAPEYFAIVPGHVVAVITDT